MNGISPYQAVEVTIFSLFISSLVTTKCTFLESILRVSVLLGNGSQLKS